MRSPTPETDELERVLRLVPDAAERHYGLALVRLILGRYDEAVEQLQLAVTADPAHCRALCRLGDSQLMAARLDDAVEAYQQAVQVKGDSVLAALSGLYISLCLMREKGRELMQGSHLLQTSGRPGSKSGAAY